MAAEACDCVNQQPAIAVRAATTRTPASDVERAKPSRWPELPDDEAKQELRGWRCPKCATHNHHDNVCCCASMCAFARPEPMTVGERAAVNSWYGKPREGQITIARYEATVRALLADRAALVAENERLKAEREAAMRYMAGRGISTCYPRSDDDEPVVWRNLSAMIVALEDRRASEEADARIESLTRDAATTSDPTYAMVCGPTCGCGKSTPMTKSVAWLCPEKCAHCGKQFLGLAGPLTLRIP